MSIKAESVSEKTLIFKVFSQHRQCLGFNLSLAPISYFSANFARATCLIKNISENRKWLITYVQSFSIQSCADPAMGIFVGCTALKPLFYTLVLTLLYNIHSTNATCAFNSWLQICKWFRESVFITLVMMSLDGLSHQYLIIS